MPTYLTPTIYLCNEVAFLAFPHVSLYALNQVRFQTQTVYKNCKTISFIKQLVIVVKFLNVVNESMPNIFEKK